MRMSCYLNIVPIDIVSALEKRCRGRLEFPSGTALAASESEPKSRVKVENISALPPRLLGLCSRIALGSVRPTNVPLIKPAFSFLIWPQKTKSDESSRLEILSSETTLLAA